MPITAKQLVDGVSDLVSLPEICFRVNEMADDPNCSAIELARTVSQDPALTVRLLKIANSPYYGFPSRVDTLTRAIAVIGTQDLRQLVLATSIMKAFDQFPGDIIDIERFWNHSVMVGLIAKKLGPHAKTPVLHNERLFVAGLLHDLGHLVMSMRIPELVRVMRERYAQGVESYGDTENLVFDVDHAEVGEALMQKWNLPESLQQVSRYHHHPEKAKKFELDVSIVHVANYMASQAHFVFIENENTPLTVSDYALKLTGFSKQTMTNVLNEAASEFGDILGAFLVPVSRKKV